MTLKIGTPVATTIQAVLVERGDRVAKGQVLARLDSAIEAADLDLNTLRATSTTEIASRTVRVELARTELNRAERLLETNNVPRQKVDELRAAMRLAREDLAQAELNYKVAQLELARSQAVLEQRTIKSPIDAIVVQRNLGPGEYAHQDSFIVELAAVSPLFVEAYPPVRYFDLIKRGDSGTVIPIGSTDRSYKAVVLVADPVFDAGSGTFGLRLAITNENGTLPAGLRCRVTFDLHELPGGTAASGPGGVVR